MEIVANDVALKKFVQLCCRVELAGAFCKEFAKSLIVRSKSLLVNRKFTCGALKTRSRKAYGFDSRPAHQTGAWRRPAARGHRVADGPAGGD